MKVIAGRQEISEPYLEQLISTLRRAGLVKSVRGAHGGYLLAYEPEKITVGSIIPAFLEGSIAPADCVSEDDPTDCKKADCCVTRGIWEKIRISIDSVIDSITLQDMIDDYYELQKQEKVYYI